MFTVSKRFASFLIHFLILIYSVLFSGLLYFEISAVCAVRFRAGSRLVKPPHGGSSGNNAAWYWRDTGPGNRSSDEQETFCWWITLGNE